MILKPFIKRCPLVRLATRGAICAIGLICRRPPQRLLSSPVRLPRRTRTSLDSLEKRAGALASPESFCDGNKGSQPWHSCGEYG